MDIIPPIKEPKWLIKAKRHYFKVDRFLQEIDFDKWTGFKNSIYILMILSILTTVCWIVVFRKTDENAMEFSANDILEEGAIQAELMHGELWPYKRMDEFLQIKEADIANGYLSEHVTGVSIHTLITLNEEQLRKRQSACIFPSSYMKSSINILTMAPSLTCLNAKIESKEGIPKMKKTHLNNETTKMLMIYPIIKINCYKNQTINVVDTEISSCIQSYQ